MAIKYSPVIKKNGKVKACMNFKNMNLATRKDKYIMPIANMLIDLTSTHGILMFMGGYLGYNQIFVAKQDTHETIFQCLGALRIYEWVVMPFRFEECKRNKPKSDECYFS